MLTSFFRKSKPINYTVIGLFLLYHFLFDRFSNLVSTLEFFQILKIPGTLVLLTLIIIILNNLIQRNKVTQRNTFTILLFVVFTGFFPAVFSNFKMILTGFLLALALKQCISLKNKKQLPRKILDMSIGLAIMVFFFEAGFVFLALPFLAVLIFQPENLKTWSIPFVAYSAITLIAICVSSLFSHGFFELYNFHFLLNLDFQAYQKQGLILPLGVILAFNLWLLVHFFKLWKEIKEKNKAPLILVFWFWAASVFTIFFTFSKNGSELILFIIPLSILGSLYFEQRKDKLLKELILITLLLISLGLPFFI